MFNLCANANVEVGMAAKETISLEFMPNEFLTSLFTRHIQIFHVYRVFIEEILN